jgi:AcrR family transcriptional regulator
MSDAVTTRQRIIEATYTCVARDGLEGTTLEAVAHEGGVSRATVYRHFPGGRDELLQAMVAWEGGQFLARWQDDAVGAADLAEWLARGLASGRRRLDDHQVLQHALELEADQLLPRLVTVMPLVLSTLREELAARLARERLRPGVDRGEAADLLARLVMSFLGTAGCWDLDDPAEVERLVHTQLLAGILVPA